MLEKQVMKWISITLEQADTLSVEKLAEVCKICAEAAKVFATEEAKQLQERAQLEHGRQQTGAQANAFKIASDAVLKECSTEAMITLKQAFEDAKPLLAGHAEHSEFDQAAVKDVLVQDILPQLLTYVASTLAADSIAEPGLDVCALVLAIAKDLAVLTNCHAIHVACHMWGSSASWEQVASDSLQGLRVSIKSHVIVASIPATRLDSSQ